MIHRCDCCGFEQDLTSGEAFQAGWDAPPHFTQYVSCPLCPALCAMELEGHVMAHTDWERNGRPVAFDERCLTDQDFGKTRTELDVMVERGKEIAGEILKNVAERN